MQLFLRIIIFILCIAASFANFAITLQHIQSWTGVLEF